MTGFFEEAKGVRSITRLTIFLITLAILGLVATICWYVIKGKGEAVVITSLGGVLLTLVAKGAVAIINRNSGEEDKPQGG